MKLGLITFAAWTIAALVTFVAACSSASSAPIGPGGNGDAAAPEGSPFGTPDSSAADASWDGGPGSGACGTMGQACCANSVCNGSLVCQAGSCAAPPKGIAGTRCMRNGDCPTGICLPVGGPAADVCTTTCTSASSCVAGWTCSPLIGQSSNVCQCTYAPEVCDGKDNDCDGIVDDEPAVDQQCASAIGAGGVCQGGACVCGAGTMTCAGRCANPQTNGDNCGGCGNICKGGMICSGGACTCPSGTTLCAGACVNTQTDSANCGGCAGAGGTVCSGGTSCSGGRCGCTGGETLCGASCTNTQTDSSNCGGCAGAGGKVCSGGTSCVGGSCICPAGQTFCGSSCTNTQTDVNNCGMCGNACPGDFSNNPAPFCSGGTCLCEVGPCITSNGLAYCCPSGQTCYQDFTCEGACCH